MRLASAVALLFAIAAPLAALDAPGQEFRFGRSRAGLPVLAAELGGETLRFVLDTGTSRSMIAASVAERLRLPARARFPVAAAAGPERMALCAGPLAVRVGGLALAIDCLGWVPEERLLAGAEEVDGLLGADALAAVDLWIDPRRNRIRLAPPGTLAPWVEGERLPVELVELRPAIAVALPGLGRGAERARLVIDSGADRTLLFGALARRAARAPGAAAAAGRLTTAAGSVGLALLPLGPMRAGGSRFDLGTAGILPAIADRHEDGLLPLAALGPVLFDLAGGFVLLDARLRSTPDRESARGGLEPAGAAPDAQAPPPSAL